MPTKPKKPTVVYEEKYVGLMVREDKLPTMPHVADFDVVSVEVRTAGKMSDGTEFQNLRVVFREKES